MNSLFLCLEKTDPTRPLVFQVVHRMPSERKGPHPFHPLVRRNIGGCALRVPCLPRERVEAGRAPRCCSSLGTSGDSENLEKSNLATGSTSQSMDMGRTCKQVVALIGNILGQIISKSFADWVSCTNKDWLCWSHRAVKKRQDNASHGRPHSYRESSLEHGVASCTFTLRVKERTMYRTHRRGKSQKKAPRPARRQKSEEAKRRPSHFGRVGLRENPLQHIRRNTRNRQIR